jgi:hypothetical protein
MQTYNLLLAEDTDGGCLGWFFGRSIGVDRDASASGLGLFVFAMDAVLFGDRHLEFGVGWLKTTLKTRKRGRERARQKIVFAWQDPVFLILSPSAFHCSTRPSTKARPGVPYRAKASRIVRILSKPPRKPNNGLCCWFAIDGVHLQFRLQL